MAKKNALRRAASGGLTVYRTQLQKVKDRAKPSRIASAAKREAETQANVLISVASAAAMGWAKKNKVALPTVAGIEPALLYGGVLAYFGPKIAKGKQGQMVQAVGSGLLTLGAYNYVRTGSATLAGTGGVSAPPGYFQNSSDVDVDE